jgi:TatA/E family protein of Tat protein translocase
MAAGGHARDSRICTNAFLGVGAPEAVLVGVVALVLFGPKGLAQAAKSLGQAVKAIAPTLRELTDISTDLKSTIEDEIGLSEIRDELQSTLSPTPRPKPVRELRSFEENVSDDPDIDEKRKESAKLAWGSAVEDSSSEVPSQKSVDSMSLEDLEKEILRRRAAESNETQS